MAKKSTFLDSKNLKRGGTVAVGMVGAKLTNSLLTKVPFLNRFITGSGKLSQLVLPGIKMVGGVYMMSRKDQMTKDLGVGVLGVGMVEGLQALVPSVNLSGLGSIDDMEFLGGTIDINLDELGGHYTDNSFESYQSIAGHESDGILESFESITGGYDYADEYVEMTY
ncbi:MAG: hypothetical protein AAF985_17660 [Bacteroidota bacterium]